MQLTISTSLQQAQFDYSQLSLSQSATTSAPQLPVSPQQDRIELSDESRRPREREHVGHVRRAHHDRNGNPLLDFLKNMLEQITGSRIQDLQKAPESSTTPAPAPAPQGQEASFSAQQASLSYEASSLSIDGSITTADGAKLSFDLDLQVMHASASAGAFSLNSGQNGYEFSFAGSEAELTSTSFSFSLTAETPDGIPATGNGLGTFSLKDDLKEVRHALKPLVKEFLHDAGMPSDRRSVNQLLHAIV